MSAGVRIWKDVLLKAAPIPARKAAAATIEPVINFAARQPVISLVRQIFFPAAMVQRTHVLLAAADTTTDVSAICEQLGRVLAEMSGARVAIVEASRSPDAAPALKKSPHNTEAEWWRSYSSQLMESLWRVPSFLMSNPSHLAGSDHRIATEAGGLPFDYVIFAAALADAELPLFCNVCDGAVLVLTANHTRREAALRARDQLLQYNAELLGTVLDGRTFPVPEAIYRRL